MPHLSSSITQIKPHYEVVVVGSGYGGAIAASRLARAKREVCVLERGRERWPGEYPDTAWEGARELQLHTPDGHHAGSPTALFDIHAGDDLSILVGCGLGGTSLINANVALEPDDRVWDDHRWPSALRDDDAGRGEAYCRVRTMLDPTPLPGEAQLKLAALQKAAEGTGRGGNFKRTDLYVVFDKNGKTNNAGVHQPGCTLCGDCCSGCNVGAKTTTLMTYIPDAWAHGAKIFTEVLVKYLTREGNGWRVHLDYLGVGRERFTDDTPSITADIVVLGAGTLGSTEILLRSVDRGVHLSPCLGSSLSGNGDVLAFGYDCDDPINGVGDGSHHRDVDSDQLGGTHHLLHHRPAVGPCITGVIDERKSQPNLGDGHIYQEGSIPGALGPGIAWGLDAFALINSERVPRVPAEPLHRLVDSLKSLLGGPHHGAMYKTITYLAMGHDDAGGHLMLVDDGLRTSFDGVADLPTFQHADDTLAHLTGVLQGRLVRDPLWTDLPHRRVISVHPLGGCPMGETINTGVVDDRCRVFSAEDSGQPYESLYVMDGSIVPMSLGANPSITIAALAERACKLLCERNRWTFDESTTTGALHLPEREAVGLRFTETMHGTIQLGSDEEDVSFVVTIEIDDVDALEKQPSVLNRLAGTVSLPAIDENPITIVGGTFQLFVDNPDAVDQQNMKYHLPLVTGDGRRLLLAGEKTIGDHAAVRAWLDTTTLAVTLYDGDTEGDRILGKGKLKLTPVDLAHELRTMEVLGAHDFEERAATLAKFGRRFGTTMFEHYGSVAVPNRDFDPDAPPRKRRPLDAPVREIYDFWTDDAVRLRLTRFNGGNKGPVLLVHGLGVSSEIFSTDLIDTNLVEYLTGAEYDVWLLDFRVSIALPSSKQQSTADQIAQYDHPAAVQKVLDETGAESLQAVVHCYGSNTFVMSMLRGWTNKQHIRSMVCSQVATHLTTGWFHQFEGGLHLPNVIKKLGFDTLTAYVDAHEDWKNHLFDEALKLQILPHGQRCHSAVCHRASFIFGLLYQHENLNERFHENLHELFGVVNLTGMEQLATMVRKGHVVDAAGDEIYLREQQLQNLALPILFISGSKNECYKPVSTKKTLKLLQKANGNAYYEREVIDGFGHLDSIFGRNAVEKVYPRILRHLDGHGSSA